MGARSSRGDEGGSRGDEGDDIFGKEGQRVRWRRTVAVEGALMEMWRQNRAPYPVNVYTTVLYSCIDVPQRLRLEERGDRALSNLIWMDQIRT